MSARLDEAKGAIARRAQRAANAGHDARPGRQMRNSRYWISNAGSARRRSTICSRREKNEPKSDTAGQRTKTLTPWSTPQLA